MPLQDGDASHSVTKCGAPASAAGQRGPPSSQATKASRRTERANIFNNNEQLTLGQSVCNNQEKENKNLLAAEAVSGPVIWGVISETPGTETGSTVF